MGVPQLILDGSRLLLALAAPASLVALVLAGIALRREGTTSFSVGGGGFSKWMRAHFTIWPEPAGSSDHVDR
jgi:hypothetical protein